MINADELLFSVDENNNPIEPQPRSLSHQTGIWHRVSHVWITDGKGNLLCQQRSMLKDSNPGCWEPFFGGHLAPGQEYLAGARSELQEELGIQAAPEEFRLWQVYKLTDFTEYEAVFALQWNGSLDSLAIEKEEVEKVEWRSIAEVRQATTNAANRTWTHCGYEPAFLDWLETSAGQR